MTEGAPLSGYDQGMRKIAVGIAAVTAALFLTAGACNQPQQPVGDGDDRGGQNYQQPIDD